MLMESIQKFKKKTGFTQADVIAQTIVEQKKIQQNQKLKHQTFKKQLEHANTSCQTNGLKSQPLKINEITETVQESIENDFENVQPLKVVIMGLSFTGKKIIAEMLKELYGFKILRLEEDQPQTTKNVTNLCFQQYKGRAVYVLQKANYQTLKNLKKRNFVNVIVVEASAFKRYHNYVCDESETIKDESLETFLKKDDKQNDEEFQKCLDWVKVRICNRQGFDFLRQQLIIKKDLILKPFRPSWEQYFMKIADIAKRRSNCMKSSVGAVIVNQQNRVISTGYNGTAKGLQSCFKDGCNRCNSNSTRGLDMCLCLHAQQSAIIEVGINRTKGCHLYTTLYPCFSCAKVIKQAGITKIFYFEQYDKQDSGKSFLEANFDAKNAIKQVKIINFYY